MKQDTQKCRIIVWPVKDIVVKKSKYMCKSYPAQTARFCLNPRIQSTENGVKETKVKNLQLGSSIILN